jgi:hypothetical protein
MSEDVREVNQLEALREDSEPHSEPVPPAARPRPAAPPQAPVEPEGSENDQSADESVQTGGSDQEEPEEKPKPPTTTLEEDLASLIATSKAKKWEIGADAMKREYIQRELSVVGKVQWFALVGDILEKALSGENRLTLNSLLTPPEIKQGQPVMPQFADADTFVHACGKLLMYSPEFLTSSVCIWLSVPDYEQDLVEQLMALSPEEGGLSDDDFEEMFNHFIDQNYMSIERFFRERFPRLQKRLQVRRREMEGQSASRKR